MITSPRAQTKVSFRRGPPLPEETQFHCLRGHAVRVQHDGLRVGLHGPRLLGSGRHPDPASVRGIRVAADDSDIREHLIPPPKDMAEPETDHTNTTIGEVLRANLAKMIDLPAVEPSTSSTPASVPTARTPDRKAGAPEAQPLSMNNNDLSPTRDTPALQRISWA